MSKNNQPIKAGINARDILGLAEDQIWALYEQYEPTDLIQLEFDDVHMVSTIPKTIVSYYFWRLHRLYPETPLLAEHHVGSHQFTGKLIPKITTLIAKSIIDVYMGKPGFDLMKLGEDVYRTHQAIFNMTVSKLGSHVETIDARDYINVLYHPEIDAVRQACIADPSPKSIRTLYEKIPEIMSHPEFLPGNGLVADMRAELSSIGQNLQSVGIRGYVTDVDSNMFKHPIMASFGSGITHFSDFLIETRSASKALMFQVDPIRDTEYFNRRIQLINQPLRYVFEGDCGTKNFLPWEVQPGDLKALDGKFYIGEDDKLQAIKPTDIHLVGKTIKLRSAPFCDHKHLNGICQTCLGMTSYTIPPGTNIGHFAAYNTGEKITQTVLSVKHLDGSTEIKQINLDKTDLQYVRLSTKRNELIKFTEKFVKMNPTILLPVDSVSCLTQAMASKNLKSLSIYKVSQLIKIGVRYTVGDETVTEWVTVSGPSRPSSLTTEFLEHIRETKYRQEDSKYIEVRLEGWNPETPAFQLPPKQVNMLDFMRQFSAMIECGPKEGAKKGLNPSIPEDVAAYIRSLLDFSGRYISLPLMFLEITTLALTVTSNEEGDYRIPADIYNREFASSDTLMHYRSVGSALVYEKQVAILTNTKSFNKCHRVPHPMDHLFIDNSASPFYDKWDRNKQQ